MPSIQLHGKIFLKGTINALTGLHIGGSSNDFSIGGNENPVIRNPFTRQPYIPGSSLRGKMRSLLDRHFRNPLYSQGSVQVHECRDAEAYTGCSVCQVFGVTPQRLKQNTMPTRLIVRDTFLSCESVEYFDKADTDTDFTEIKMEVAIDRITSEANPRPNERVPAGATFDPLQLVYSLYTQDTDNENQLKNECELFDTVLKGMALLEDDYLGGSGSRGSGQIAFEHLEMTFKSRGCYENADIVPITIAENVNIKTLRQSDYTEQILKAISSE